MKFICDTDVLSMFAKIDKIDLLKKLSKEKLLSAEEVKEELLIAKNHGYDFVDKILKEVDFLDLNEKEREEYSEILEKDRTLNSGEIQAMVLAKNRDYTVLTNDKSAHRYCEKHNIDYLDVQRTLRFMIIQNLIDSGQAKKIVKQIEDKDNTIIKGKEEIWKDLE